MCSRYELNASNPDVAARFGLTVPPVAMPQATVLRPTDRALVIPMGGGALAQAWGLKVDWDVKPLINARAETLGKRPTFKPLLTGSRVLVPATAFFEWRKECAGTTRMRIALDGGGLFAFAGLSDGNRFTIVTCAACTQIAAIHKRMPVILPPAAEAAWLDGATPPKDVGEMLRPYVGPLTIEEDEDPPRQPDMFG